MATELSKDSAAIISVITTYPCVARPSSVRSWPIISVKERKEHVTPSPVRLRKSSHVVICEATVNKTVIYKERSFPKILILWGYKWWYEPLIIFTMLTTAMETNISRWLFTYLERFSKTSRPIDGDISTFTGPICIISTVQPLQKTRKARNDHTLKL